MTLTVKLLLITALVLSIIIPFGYFLIGEKTKKRYKRAVGVNAFFYFGAFAIAAILAAALNKPRLSFAFGILSLCLCLFELVNTFSNLGEYATFVNKGMGCYLSLISVIALIIFCALFFFSARKRR